MWYHQQTRQVCETVLFIGSFMGSVDKKKLKQPKVVIPVYALSFFFFFFRRKVACNVWYRSRELHC